MKNILTLIALLLTINLVAQKTESKFEVKSYLDIPDSLRPPQRLIWNGEKGVFLTQTQEVKTLEQLQWKSIYQNDAITFYMVSLQLNDKVNDLENLLSDYQADLDKCEQEAADKNQKMLDYQKSWEDEKAANAALRDDKLVLKRKLTKSIVLNVGLGAGLGLATYYIVTH